MDSIPKKSKCPPRLFGRDDGAAVLPPPRASLDASVMRRARVPPGVPEVSSRLARRHVTRLGSDEPSSCPPWAHVRHGADFCWACANSTMAISCDNAISKCTKPQMERLAMAHKRQPSLLHAPLPIAFT